MREGGKGGREVTGVGNGKGKWRRMFVKWGRGQGKGIGGES